MILQELLGTLQQNALFEAANLDKQDAKLLKITKQVINNVDKDQDSRRLRDYADDLESVISSVAHYIEKEFPGVEEGETYFDSGSHDISCGTEYHKDGKHFFDLHINIDGNWGGGIQISIATPNKSKKFMFKGAKIAPGMLTQALDWANKNWPKQQFGMKPDSVFEVYAEHNKGYQAWIAAVRKVWPNATIAGSEHNAQMVDWTTPNNEVAGDWDGKTGVVYKPGSNGKKTI